MYQIEHIHFGQFSAVKLRHSSTGCSVTIIPEFGGAIVELLLADGENKLHSVIEGATNADELKGQKKYNSAKLIPFPNRIPDGRYSFEGVDYQLPINRPQENNAIHGFMHDRPYIVVLQKTNNDDALIILRHQYKGDYVGYPFEFEVELTYHLSDNEFKYTTCITNQSDSPIPIADGWHPYLQLGKPINELQLQFPSTYEIKVDDRKIPTGRREPYTVFNKLNSIGSTELDTAFIINLENEIAVTSLYDPVEGLGVSLKQSTGHKGYNYLQVYTPNHRKSIAIEPMTCIANSFNNGEGLISLSPGESIETTCEVSLFKKP